MRKGILIAVMLVLALVAVAGIVNAGNGNGNGGFVPVTLCHITGNGSYNEITVDNQGALNGHSNHDGDIIPMPEGGCPSNEDDGGDEGGDDEPELVCPDGYHLVGEMCELDDVPPDDGGDDGGDEGGDEGGNEEKPPVVRPVVRVAQPQWEPGADSITAWSVESEGPFTWMYSPTGTEPWYVVYNRDGSLAVTYLELRDRPNRAMNGEVERDVHMTRLTLGPNGDTDPTHYRLFDLNSGAEVVVTWMEHGDEWCQDFNVCGDTDYRGE